MSDMSDAFRDLRADSQKRRANNRERSAEMLQEAGIAFESKNAGAHLIVYPIEGNLVIVDFWPGTGLWRVRGTGDDENRGVNSLIQYCKRCE